MAQCKVDRPYQGKGAKVNAQNKGTSHKTVKFKVLETNDPAKKCYAKAGLREYPTLKNLPILYPAQSMAP